MNVLTTTRGVWRVTLRAIVILAVAAIGFAALRLASVGPIVSIVRTVFGILLLALCVTLAVDRGRRQAFAVGFVICALAYWLVLATGAPYFLGSMGTSRVTSLVHRQIATFRPVGSETTQPQSSTSSQGGANFSDLLRLQQMLGGPDGRGGRASGGGRGSFRGRPRGTVPLPPPSRDGTGITPSPPPNTERESSTVRLFRDQPWASPPGQGVPTPGSPPPPLQQLGQYGLLGTGTREQIPKVGDFQTVARCLWMLFIGYAGGSFARYVYGKRTRLGDGAK